MKKWKSKIAPTAGLKSKKDFSLDLINLHSELYEVAASYEALGDSVSGRELRRGKPARWAFARLNWLRKTIPSEALLLRDISLYYRKVAVKWDWGWCHGALPIGTYLDAIEIALDLALSGDVDFTRPLRKLSQIYPYNHF